MSFICLGNMVDAAVMTLNNIVSEKKITCQNKHGKRQEPWSASVWKRSGMSVSGKDGTASLRLKEKPSLVFGHFRGANFE